MWYRKEPWASSMGNLFCLGVGNIERSRNIPDQVWVRQKLCRDFLFSTYFLVSFKVILFKEYYQARADALGILGFVVWCLMLSAWQNLWWPRWASGYAHGDHLACFSWVEKTAPPWMAPLSNLDPRPCKWNSDAERKCAFPRLPVFQLWVQCGHLLQGSASLVPPSWCWLGPLNCGPEKILSRSRCFC